MKFPRVRDLVSNFDFEILCGNAKALEREITLADTNRPGLELSGFFNMSQNLRILVLGDKEIAYIDTLDDNHQNRVFDFLTDKETPVLIISNSHTCPPILEQIAQNKNFPILRSNLPTSRLIIQIVTFLDEHLAPVEALHGVLLSIYGKGILIRGDSGMGKSEVALDLVRRGHQLISDDLVDCKYVHNEVIGYPPKLLDGFIELRGIGIVNIRKLYGKNSTLPKAKIDFVIELKMWDDTAQYDRVGIEEPKYEEIFDAKIPKIILPLRGGRSMATLIEGAVTNIVLREEGYDSAKEFEKRVLAFIDAQQGEKE